MKIYRNILILVLSLIGSFVHAQDLEFKAGDPVKFIQPSFIYQNPITTAPIVATAEIGERATVRNSYFYKRDIRTNYDPIHNPNVEWADIVLERTPPVFGSFPVDYGLSPGLSLAHDVPAGSFPFPVLLPSPTVIKPNDLITVNIVPTLSHRIRFGYDTQVRRSGTNEEFESVGGSQSPEYEPNKSYTRFLRVPEWMTTGITSSLLVDMRTIISFGDVEIASRQVNGAIVVLSPPPPVLELIDLGFNENGDFFATLSGAQIGKRYWVESSGILTTWRRRYSITGSVNPQAIFLPPGNTNAQFFRVKSD